MYHFLGQESLSRSQILTGTKIHYAAKGWHSLENKDLKPITLNFWNITDYLGSLENKQVPALKCLPPNRVFTAYLPTSGTFPW